MRAAIACLLAVASASAAAAVEPDHRAEGMQALREGRWSDAESGFGRALAADPRDGDLAALLGIARWHRGDSRYAADALRQALALGTRLEARALYYLALVQVELGEAEEARVTLARLQRSHPDSPEAEQVRASRALTAAGAPARDADDGFGEILLLLQGGWDEHPDEIGDTAVTTSAGSDWYWLAHLDIGLRPGFAHFAGAYTHLDYATENQLDADSLRVSADRSFDHGDQDRLTPRYSLRLLWLERDFYETRHDLSLRWSRPWSAERETDVTPYLAWRTHADEYAGEDGWGGGLDARSTRHLVDGGPVRHVRLGLGVHTLRAADAWLGWTEVGADAGGYATLPGRFGIDGDLRLQWRGYGAEDPLAGERRSDWRAEAELTLDRPLRSWLTAELTGLYALNRSTLDEFDYGRAVATVGLVAFF